MGDGNRRFAAIVLAAGGSRRMGRPKQLLPYAGRSLIEHAIQIAIDAGCGEVYAVVGAAANRIAPIVASTRAHVVENAHWQDGMAGSIRVGLDAADANGSIKEILFTLVDQPLVTSAALAKLLEAFDNNAVPAAASLYAGGPGVPAVFSRTLFPELRALRGAEGAKTVLARHRDRLIILPLPEAAIDVDRPADYESLLAQNHPRHQEVT
jgi:molybdenum cofactor cytidylyltransferase